MPAGSAPASDVTPAVAAAAGSLGLVLNDSIAHNTTLAHLEAVSRRGVIPLAPSLDTVGPMAATVDGLVTGMALPEPGFTAATLDVLPLGNGQREVGPFRIQAGLVTHTSESYAFRVSVDGGAGLVRRRALAGAPVGRPRAGGAGERAAGAGLDPPV